MRLAAQKKGGFYPAHPDAVAMALGRLDRPEGDLPCTVCDPCAGEGAALKQLAAGLVGAVPYAIELEKGRAALVRELFGDKALAPCSTFAAKCTGGHFQALWLNPPYDDEVGGGSRVEQKFLWQCSPWLQAGGVLMLVVPERIIGRYSPTLVYLWERYDSLTWEPFPDEHRRFKEVVVYGVRRGRIRELSKERRDDPPLLERAGPGDRYRVPHGSGPATWQKVAMTDEEIAEALARSPLQRHLRPPPARGLPRPPLSLNKGHHALLLSSGHLDGEVRPPGEPPHVVRGVAVKTKFLKEETVEELRDGTVKTRSVYGERIDLTVRAIDGQGNLRTFQTAGAGNGQGTAGDADQGVG